MDVDHQKEEEFKLIKERKVINKNWKELIKPKKIEFVKDKNVDYCTLPYGYGLTFIRNKANIENKVELTWRKR